VKVAKMYSDEKFKHCKYLRKAALLLLKKEVQLLLQHIIEIQL